MRIPKMRFLRISFLFLLLCSAMASINIANGQAANSVISGEVTSEATGLAIPGVSVKIESVAWFSYVTYVSTDNLGNYKFTGVVDGEYYISTSGNSTHLGEYYNNSSTKSSAAPITVASGSNKVIDFQLALGGSVSGRVTRDLDGSPIKDATINPYNSSGFSLNTTSDASGYYRITGLEANTYRVKAYRTGYSNEYYHNPAGVNTAYDITVVRGVEVPNIDLRLKATGSIAGKVVRESDGTGIPNIQVSVKTGTGNWLSSVTTNSSGEFTISNLDRASYIVRTFTMNGYLTEYYDNTDSIDAATPVVIGDGTQITGIVLSPPLGGSITGRVVQDSGGTAISNASVVLYSSNWSSWNTFYTDSNGYYCITGLESGSYYLAAAGAGSSEYYDNASSRDSATPVAAVRGRNTPDINFSLGSSPSVSGRVTRDYDGAGIPNITVEVYIVRDAKIYNRQSTATDASGYYSMTVYSAGGYYVKAVGNNDYFGELYNNATSEAQATMVNLVSGINTPNIIFSLATYGFISGRITNNSGGAAIPNATVTIYNENGNIYTQSSNASDATGYYRIRLSPGRYFIKAEDPLGAGVQYFDKADSLASARLIVLNSGQGIENINFSLFTSSVGSISGRVVIDTNGAGLQGAQVLAYSNSTNIYKSATTDASGYFKIAGLEPGQYYVRVSASGLTAVYISELFDNIPYNDSNSFSESVATQVEVKPGMDTPDINFGLSEYGSISGRVTRDSDGAPLPNMYVRLYKPNLSTIWQDVSTDSSGNYKLSNLAPGEYFIFVHSNKEYVDKFYNDASSLISATPIMVRSGLETANINFGLTVGGSISGRITRDSDGAGLPNINVLASSIDGTSYRNGHSDSAGYYKITGMSGSVTVRAESNSFYIGEYYKDSANAPTAATVTPGFDTGNINLSLATGGVISGHVTCDTSVSEIIYINVYDSSWNLLQSPAFSSNATISYVIQGLAPGGYYLKTHSLIGVCTDKYYNNTASQNEAALISVAQGVDTGNINFNLNLDAIISGRVVCDSDSAAISGVDIQVYDAGWSMIASARTGSSGDYRIPNLVPGKYYLKTSNSLGYIDEYYNNAVNQNSAFQVETTAGVETQNINFSLRSNGSILGRVTQDADGTPIRNVAVLAYDSKWSFVASTTTDALGDYVIARLPSGAYYLQASAPGGSGFRDEYYNNAASRNAATAVAVEPGSDATGVNFELASGGAISGRITRNSDGVGIASAKISVYKLNKELESTVLSDSSGYYIVAGLPAGSYYVQVSVGSAYIGEYYNNAPSITTATTVSVANGNDTGNINFGLAGEKSITGKVIRDKDGAPIPGVIVQAFSNFSSISRISANKATTNNLGEYYIEGLTPGKYYVSISNTFGYVDEYYNDATELGATPVDVTQAATTSDINFSLASGGSISGRVMRDPGGISISHATIRVYDSRWNLVQTVQNAFSDGAYRATGLKAGQYYLRASAMFFGSKYFLQANSRSSAALISVIPETDVRDINFILSFGRAISGRITRESDGTGIEDVTVQAFNSAGELVQSTLSEALGYYSIEGLEPGVYFVSTSNTLGLIDEYYDNAFPRSAAIEVTVTILSDTGNINIALGTGGTISGQVVQDSNGAGIPNVEVRAYAGQELVKSATTDSTGAYSIKGIAPGNYYVRTYNAPGYTDKFYAQAASSQEASTAPVLSGSNTGNINFSLSGGLSINGVVARNSDGIGIHGVSVLAYNKFWEKVASSTTDSSGAYNIKELAPGDYFLQTANTLGYKDEFCQSAETPDKATKINIIEGSRTVDFSLESVVEDAFKRMRDRINSE